MKTLLVLTACLLLAGCGTPKVWYQPGVTEEQTRRDLAACKAKVELTDPGYGGQGLGLAIAAGEDSSRKKRIVRDLMEAKGYELIPVTEATNYPVKLGL